MTAVRKPAVAGLFYPNDPRALRAQLETLLAQVPETSSEAPKAIIAPHAGYIYSGPIAASAYARLKPVRGRIRRVVLLGPAHRVGFHGLARASAEYFESPLGRVRVDAEAMAQIADLPQVVLLDAAHANEHSLEVHLPFLQTLFDDFTLVPLVVGAASPAEVGEVIDRLWGGPETLIVISSDLSHYHAYATAQALDRNTSQAIERLRYEDIDHEGACGRTPMSGLLYVARRRGLSARTIDLRNSGDTAGPRDQVVGYGAYIFQ
jgi:AmmeMemoRadiSam system protein B